LEVEMDKELAEWASANERPDEREVDGWSHTGAPCEMEQEIAEELLSQEDLTEAIVPKKPKCDFCNAEAEFDGRTVLGPWAYMCNLHFGQYGVGLGLGRGQKLIVQGE